jgi:microsomal dipeptidase-like Zn-dependent dipeptidase
MKNVLKITPEMIQRIIKEEKHNLGLDTEDLEIFEEDLEYLNLLEQKYLQKVKLIRSRKLKIKKK